MEKKEFNAPAIKVMKMRCCDVICTSGDTGTSGSSDGTLGKGVVGGDGSPTANSDGYIIID